MARECLAACVPSRRASFWVAGALAFFALIERLGELGARVGPLALHLDWYWLAAAPVLAFLLASPEARPLRPGPMLGGLVALMLAGFGLHVWGQPFFAEPRPLRARILGAPPEEPARVVELPLRLEGRQQLDRLVGRPRQVGFDASASVYAPEAGTYRFHLSCDDQCRLGLSQGTVLDVSGAGSVDANLSEGVHELRLSYQQSSGPAHFALSWDRPAVVELLPLDRFMAAGPAGLPAALRRERALAALLLPCEALLWSLGLGWLLRGAEHVRAQPAYRSLLLVNAVAMAVASWILVLAGVARPWAASPLWAGTAVTAALVWRSTKGLPLHEPRVAIKACLVIACSGLLVVLVDRHVSGMNGPDYWRWPWRRLPGLPLFAAMLVPLLGFLSAQRVRRGGSRSSLRAAISLLMASHLAFQLVALGVQDDPVSLEGVAGRVMHPGTSGYYAEALRVGQAERWLESYPRLLPSFHLHGRTKPPGPILFHRAFQKALGEGPRAAQAAGLAIGLLATLSIPASFLLIRLLTASEEAAFAGASFLALCPGPILFFPQLDQVYPVVSCALVGCWVLALATQRIRYACAFGLVSSLALFFSYSLLTLGVVLGLFTLASVQRRRSLRFAVAGSAAALGSLCAVYAAVFGATGFDPIETFRTAVANQAAILPRLGRPYPGSIPFDLLDFALGAGWISAPLVAFFLFDGGAGAGAASRRAAIFGLVQIVGLALTGLVQTETARVWQFLLPLFLCPVGCELAAWRPAQRNSVYACLWLVTTTICRNMRFQ